MYMTRKYWAMAVVRRRELLSFYDSDLQPQILQQQVAYLLVVLQNKNCHSFLGLGLCFMRSSGRKAHQLISWGGWQAGLLGLFFTPKACRL